MKTRIPVVGFSLFLAFAAGMLLSKTAAADASYYAWLTLELVVQTPRSDTFDFVLSWGPGTGDLQTTGLATADYDAGSEPIAATTGVRCSATAQGYAPHSSQRSTSLSSALSTGAVELINDGAEPKEVTVTFNLDHYIDTGTLEPCESASATCSSAVDPPPVLDELLRGAAESSGDPISMDYTVTLQPGSRLTFTLSASASGDAASGCPEPCSLVGVGLGLALAGATTRRRRDRGRDG